MTVDIAPSAQHMLDEADERWISEHGYLADNPLFGEIEHASYLLRDNPEIGISFPMASSVTRRGACS
ncbi:hypothetical protein BH11MYX2_BH11MYX2_04550 [soil metagenome]